MSAWHKEEKNFSGQDTKLFNGEMHGQIFSLHVPMATAHYSKGPLVSGPDSPMAQA